jgi:TonB family protein
MKIFYSSFFVSFIFHLAILLSLIILAKEKKYINIDSKTINIQNISFVDTVDLPNVLKKDIPLINKTKTPKNKKDQMVYNPKPNIDRIKAIAKLRKKVQKQEYLDKIKKIRGQGEVFKSNESFLTYNSNSINNEKDLYLLKIKNLVSSNWIIPNWISIENKRVLIKAYIDFDGTILKIELIQSSGNEDLDISAIEAIEKTKTFFPTPEKYKNNIKKNGITFSFP